MNSRLAVLAMCLGTGCTADLLGDDLVNGDAGEHVLGGCGVAAVEEGHVRTVGGQSRKCSGGM